MAFVDNSKPIEATIHWFSLKILFKLNVTQKRLQNIQLLALKPFEMCFKVSAQFKSFYEFFFERVYNPPKSVF